MNWDKIQEKYSEQFQEWIKFRYGKAKSEYQFILKESKLSYHWGWIEDFFDSKGIYIYIARSGKGAWYYEIMNNINEYFDEGNNVKSRNEAREAAILKAFEILKEIKK